jgi:hypothetical protein
MSLGAASARIASRGAPLRPLPSRSALRKTTIVPQLPAKPMSGRDASASA